ncbi:MAG: ABC-2 family transporter protein [Eubacteriales bacterium]|nr:ABC-2 family transporter protein [Eubacteriales bacterium]
MRTLKKYVVLYFCFIKNSIMAQMEYRINFIISMCIQLAYMGIKLTYVVVLYHADIAINGFSPDEMMIMIGTYSALSGVFVSFFLLNFSALPELIKSGSLDSYIVKPVSLQFMVTLRRVDLAFATVSVIVGGAMVGIGWYRAGVTFSLINVLGFLGFTFWGLFLTYSLFLIPNIISFWTVSSRGLGQFVNQLWDFNNMPMTIYSNSVKFIGTFIIPVFLITNTGGLFILRKLSPLLMFWAIFSPILLFLFCRLLWKKAIRHYVSVN